MFQLTSQHHSKPMKAATHETTCKTPEAFKAWSQNLGHEKVMTTFLNYGAVTYQRQAQIMKELAAPQHENMPLDVSELAKALCREMRVAGVGLPV